MLLTVVGFSDFVLEGGDPEIVLNNVMGISGVAVMLYEVGVVIWVYEAVFMCLEWKIRTIIIEHILVAG